MRQEDASNREDRSSGEMSKADEFAWREQQESMCSRDGYPHCANCDIDILWSPVIERGETYCCTGCAGGGPCCCDYSLHCSIRETS